MGKALSIGQVLWSFVLIQLSVSPGPCSLLAGVHPVEWHSCFCNEVATDCCTGATEQSKDASVAGEEWGQSILIAVKIAEISAFFEEQHLCKNEHHSLQFHASLMGKYTIGVRLLSDLAGCYFC